MAIDNINSGVYGDAAKRVQKETAHVAAAPVKQAPVNVTRISTSGTKAAVYKDSGLDGTKADDAVKEGEIAARQIKATVTEANFKATRTRCEYSVEEKTNRISIKLIDEQTDEVIKEIPPEKSLEMLAKVWELAGLLVDEKR